MKINVTAEDILAGLRHNCSKCPIAIALKRAFKVKNVIVNTVAFWVECLEFRIHELDDDSNIISFIHDFDHAKPVKPFSFEIRIRFRRKDK